VRYRAALAKAKITLIAHGRLQTSEEDQSPRLTHLIVLPTQEQFVVCHVRRASGDPPFRKKMLQGTTSAALCQERSCASANSEASHLHRRGIGIARGPALA
jgi:hypothetical protein